YLSVRSSPITVSTLVFFTHTATTEIYTLSLHDALPISTYTLTASQSSGAGCITTLEFEVIINPNPAPIEDSTETTCVDSILALSPNGGLVTIEETIGTETNLSTANTTTADLGPNPLQTYYGNTKQQWIYTADELTNIGFVSGSTINSITLHLSQANNYV